MNPGISKLIYKAVTGTAFNADVTVNGNDLTTDAVAALERIIGQTAGGGIRTTGNRQYDFTIGVKTADQKAAIEAHENIHGDLEIYSLDDDVTPAMTITNCNPVVNDQVQFDPSDEDGVVYQIIHQGVVAS